MTPRLTRRVPHARHLPRALSLAALALLAACDESPSAAGPSFCSAEEVLRLGVGRSVIIPDDVACTLRPQEGAEYALAWFDAQLVTLSETQPEPYTGLDTRINLAIIEGDGSVRYNATQSPVAAPELPVDTRVVQGTGPTRALGVEGAAGPWRADDVIRFASPICTGGCSGRVARVMDNWLVLAVEEASLGAATARTVALLDEVIPHFRQHALPMLRSAFTQELPVNGPESGQLVVFVRGDVSGVGGLAYGTTYPNGTAAHLLQVEMESGRDAGSLLEVLIHEVAHAFQLEFDVRNAPAAAAAGDLTRTRWAVEGGATLMETEALRRVTARPYAGNVDFRVAPASSIDAAFLRQASLGGGVFVSGYNPASSLLLDLVDRRVRAGDDVDVALREVARGAVEGWHGTTRHTPARPGMTGRMQARIPGWSAEEAILRWTLSVAADDVLKDRDLQNRAWLRVGEGDPTSVAGWPAFRVVTGGSNRYEGFSRPSGTSGWARLVDPGQGISFRVRSVPSVRWRLLRIR